MIGGIGSQFQNAFGTGPVRSLTQQMEVAPELLSFIQAVADEEVLRC